MRPRLLLVLCATAVTALAGPASAHTEVQRATPSPGAVVDAPVSTVELEFLDPVLPTVAIGVQDAAGDAVDGLGAVEHSADGRVASVSFSPLSAPGDYVVDYEFVAVDGDAQTDAYRFTVEPRSDDADGEAAAGTGVAIALALAVAVLAAVGVALRRRNVRSH